MESLRSEPVQRATFGLRKAVPRACVIDGKQHLRTFLGETLEELGFVVHGCASSDDLALVLDTMFPDLLIFGLSAGGVEATRALEAAAARNFDGKVLLLGAAASPMVSAVRSFGSRLGLTMLPILKTPFGDRDLRLAISSLIPSEAPPEPPVDAAEALDAGWLELWYQPKVATRSFVLDGAEALIRMRHPTWGVVPPAYFIPADNDPNFRALSEFVIRQVLDDWHYFITQRGGTRLAINLPLSFFRSPGATQHLCRMLPQHPAFEGLTVEMRGAEIVQDLSFANELAHTLQLHNIGISIDDLGEQWPSLAELDEFPFIEVKLDRSFAAGCADDRLRRLACRQIVDFAQSTGARTVAEGIESRGDFLTLRDMGVDLIQGYLFAKPMTAQKFARFSLRRAEPLA
jgi:EAL domain-containing protein (putative c-di-GMP-specific phosphodiesterase class I)